MSDLRQRIVLALAAQLQACGAVFGNTHLQKGVYQLEGLHRVPVGAWYGIYTYGPFSPDVRSDINALLDRGEIVHADDSPNHADGVYRVCVPEVKGGGHGWDAVRHYERHIAFVARTIRRWDRPMLEAVMTSLYLHEMFPDWDDLDISIHLREIKPHISRDFASQAVSRLNELRAEARAAGLVIGPA